MAQLPQKSIFLARKSYRQRRLRDVARVLPIIGIVMWLLPLAWRGEAGETGTTLIYIFLIWLGLIVVTAIVAARIKIDKTGPDVPGVDDD